MSVKTPLSGPAIGLFGGSFNPAHSGHLHVARSGLRNLGLDEVHWLVSPSNPLKTNQPDWHIRAQSVKDLGLSPRMRVSDIECQYGTRYTIDLLRRLKREYPNRRFVFMMGADNLLQIPQWRDWQDIFKTLPIAVISRPGTSLKARLSPAARQFAQARLPQSQAHILKDCQAPAWTYLTLPLNPLSSSAIRAAQNGRA